MRDVAFIITAHLVVFPFVYLENVFSVVTGLTNTQAEYIAGPQALLITSFFP